MCSLILHMRGRARSAELEALFFGFFFVCYFISEFVSENLCAEESTVDFEHAQFFEMYPLLLNQKIVS